MSDQTDPLTESVLAHWQAGHEAATTKPDPTELADTFAKFYLNHLTH